MAAALASRWMREPHFQTIRDNSLGARMCRFEGKSIAISVVALLATLACAGCASEFEGIGMLSATDAQQVAPNTYRISATGSAMTGFAELQERALKKAAETTLSQGGTHFIVKSSPTRTSNSEIVTGSLPSQGAALHADAAAKTQPIHTGGHVSYIEVLKVPSGATPPAGAISASEIATLTGGNS